MLEVFPSPACGGGRCARRAQRVGELPPHGQCDSRRHPHHSPPPQAGEGAQLRRGRSSVQSDQAYPPVSALMMSPNNSHWPFLKRIILSCSIGAKSLADVLTLMPGISVSGAKSFRLAACFITFSRVRLSPDCFKTCTMVCAAE